MEKKTTRNYLFFTKNGGLLNDILTPNYTDACNDNLDDGISRLVWNGNLAKICENQNNYYVNLFFQYF